MRIFFILETAFVFFMSILLTSCKKDEISNNGNNNSGGGGNQEHPSTVVVFHNAVSDIDGNCYDAVQIGNQVWMAENLRTKRFADGTSIPIGNLPPYGYSNREPYRYFPGYSGDNAEIISLYGYLYNWPAAMHGASRSDANPSGVQGICPDGWHLPSRAEWTELTNYMMTQPTYLASGCADHLAKALAATWGWGSSNMTDAPGNNLSANNATGFSALPAGLYTGNMNGDFAHRAYYWSTSSTSDANATIFYLRHDSPLVYNQPNGGGKHVGYSVRCVRD